MHPILQLVEACDTVRQHTVTNDSVGHLKSNYKRGLEQKICDIKPCCDSFTNHSELLDQKDAELKQDLAKLIGRVKVNADHSTSEYGEVKDLESPQKPQKNAARFMDRLEQVGSTIKAASRKDASSRNTSKSMSFDSPSAALKPTTLKHSPKSKQ